MARASLDRVAQPLHGELDIRRLQIVPAFNLCLISVFWETLEIFDGQLSGCRINRRSTPTAPGYPHSSAARHVSLAQRNGSSPGEAGAALGMCREGEKSGTILMCAMRGRFPLYYGIGNSLSWCVAASSPGFPHSSAGRSCPLQQRNVSIYFGITSVRDYRDIAPHFHETHVDQDPEVIRADRYYFSALALYVVQRPAKANSVLELGCVISPSPSAQRISGSAE
jgi:hypothetical protein